MYLCYVRRERVLCMFCMYVSMFCMYVCFVSMLCSVCMHICTLCRVWIYVGVLCYVCNASMLCILWALRMICLYYVMY